MDFLSATRQLSDCGAEFYRRGWVYGTSGNFSARVSESEYDVCITESGNEKGRLKEQHFLGLDEHGNVVRGEGKPSAETSLHLAIYDQLPDVGAVFHTHSVWGTLLSDVFAEQGAIPIEGYEMLKGLAGNTTHDYQELVPVLENSQDYAQLSQAVRKSLTEHPQTHGIYLRRHGLYTWGKDIRETSRHIEIFEALFECVGRLMTLKQ